MNIRSYFLLQLVLKSIFYKNKKEYSLAVHKLAVLKCCVNAVYKQKKQKKSCARIRKSRKKLCTDQKKQKKSCVHQPFRLFFILTPFPFFPSPFLLTKYNFVKTFFPHFYFNYILLEFGSSWLM